MAVAELPEQTDFRLTTREKEVLVCLAEGLTNDEIADRLVLGKETIKSHVKNLRMKMQATSRAHAVAIGFRKGMIS